MVGIRAQVGRVEAQPRRLDRQTDSGHAQADVQDPPGLQRVRAGVEDEGGQVAEQQVPEDSGREGVRTSSWWLLMRVLSHDGNAVGCRC